MLVAPRGSVHRYMRVSTCVCLPSAPSPPPRGCKQHCILLLLLAYKKVGGRKNIIKPVINNVSKRQDCVNVHCPCRTCAVVAIVRLYENAAFCSLQSCALHETLVHIHPTLLRLRVARVGRGHNVSKGNLDVQKRVVACPTRVRRLTVVCPLLG